MDNSVFWRWKGKEDLFLILPRERASSRQIIEKIVQSSLDLLEDLEYIIIIYWYLEFGRVFNHIHWFTEKYVETPAEMFCYNKQNIRVQLCNIVDL